MIGYSAAYLRDLAAEEMRTLARVSDPFGDDFERIVQPSSGGGGGAAPIEEVVITGYFNGAFGVSNSGFTARRLDADGNPTGDPIDVYVWSYSETPGSFGRLDLTSEDVGPALQALDRVPVYYGRYADVAGRWILLFPMRVLCENGTPA